MWSQDFKEFVGLLNELGVEHLIVGGYAVGVHGHPRYTGDLDIWIASTPENAARILAAVERFGFDQLGITVDDFIHEERVLQLGQPPFRIDVLTSIDGVRFADCYPNRLEIDYEGVRASFIGLEDLRRNKKASGRLKDLADLDELERGGDSLNP